METSTRTTTMAYTVRVEPESPIVAALAAVAATVVLVAADRTIPDSLAEITAAPVGTSTSFFRRWSDAPVPYRTGDTGRLAPDPPPGCRRGDSHPV